MKNLKIACIGNYPPKKCGIATFTENLIKSIDSQYLNSEIKAESHVIAINEDSTELTYPEIVKHTIRKNHQRDYIQAAEYINYSEADICILQHEFGIYGGDSGVYILSLLHKLKVPLMVTFHTILKEPSFNERIIVNEIGKLANKIIVMSKKAVYFLNKIYNIPEDKIAIIEHGVPDIKVDSQRELKKKFKIDNRKVILTFGLLGRSKGIEGVIHALPQVVRKHPDVLYIILGKTHPNVVKHSGEEYRNYLKKLINQYDIDENVYFHDEFVSEKDLYEYLNASDLYVTPYLNEAQITSGTLSYAVGAGNCVISTPYWHAQELLAHDRGILYEFGNSDQLSLIINDLFDDEYKLKSYRNRAKDYGRKIIWPKMGDTYKQIAVREAETYSYKEQKLIIDPSSLPNFNLDHLDRLTDSTGIIQHAKYSVPNYETGYCLDDNARALLLATLAIRQKNDSVALKLLPTYLSYIFHMQNPDGSFRNFMSYERKFLDEVGSEDSFGRAIWGLGVLIKYCKLKSIFDLGKEIFSKAFLYFDSIKFLRAKANMIVGICEYLNKFPSDEGMYVKLKEYIYSIADSYDEYSKDDWNWFENELTYDNAIIPLAFFHAYEIINDPRLLEIAEESTRFLEKYTLKDMHIRPIGNGRWFKKGDKPSEFDQQPLDAMAMVLMYEQAYSITDNREYLKKAFISFNWFLGDNDLRIPLYDYETHGCCDGLESHGVNRNQGAESTLAYLISHLYVLKAFESELKKSDSNNEIIKIIKEQEIKN